MVDDAVVVLSLDELLALFTTLLIATFFEVLKADGNLEFLVDESTAAVIVVVGEFSVLLDASDAFVDNLILIFNPANWSPRASISRSTVSLLIVGNIYLNKFCLQEIFTNIFTMMSVLYQLIRLKLLPILYY